LYTVIEKANGILFVEIIKQTGGAAMKKEHPYAKYVEDFRKAVAEEKAKPVVWDGDLSKVEWTFADDDTGIAEKFLKGEIKIQDEADQVKAEPPKQRKKKRKKK